MPDPARSILGAAEPQLFVAEIEASCAFYCGKLGFEVVFRYGDPPFYAQVRRGQARLNLRCVGEPLFTDRFRAGNADALSATIPLDDIEALFLEVQGAGAPFHQTLRREPWGERTFIVQDPDGNLICFSGPAA